MKPIALAFLALIGLLMCVALAGAVTSVAGQLSEPTYAELVADQVRADTLERQNELDAQYAPWRAAFLAFVVVAVTLGLMAYAGGLAAAHVRRAHLERMPNSAGLLPVLASDQATARAALSAFHGARQIEAARQLVPEHYAPHITYSPHHELEYKPVAGPAALPGDVAPALAAVPTFAALLDGGRVGKGNPLLLGYSRDTGAEIVGDWKDLYSCAVGGLSGSGKSWTATYLLAQAALHGSRLLILDPHAESAESLAARLAPLASRFVCAPATTPREMLQAVELATGELERRKAGGYARGSAPIVIVADEFSALQRGELAEPLAALVEGLAQEGRKLDLFGMVCGQVWTAARAGGTELRDSLASAYVHRLRPAQARVLTGYTAADLPGDLLTLPPGHAYMLSTAGDLRPVIIPQMTPADVARVAQLLDGSAPSPAAESAPPAAASRARSLGFRVVRPEGAGAGASEGAMTEPLRPHQDAAQLTAEEARIVRAFLEGKSPSDLAAELAGGKKSGDAFTVAARRVADILRKALGARGLAGA